MNLDPVSLQLFIRTIEEGTIARAAEKEHIAAAAISKRISDLEAALKSVLIVRTNRGVVPTSAGLALITMARRVLHDLNEISVQISEYSSGVRGLVRVCANISAITQFLPQDIKSFHNLYPDVQIHLEEQISPTILKSVQDNAADIGIFSSSYAYERVKTLSYKQDRLLLIVPVGHPLATKDSCTLTDILTYNFIGLHSGSNINHIISSAASTLRRNVNMTVQVTGFDTLCLMVESGLGLGVMPERIAHRYAAIFDVVPLPIAEPWTMRHLDICVRSLDSLPTAARLFVDHLRRGIPAD